MTDRDDDLDEFLEGLVIGLKERTSGRYVFTVEGCRVFVDRVCQSSHMYMGHLVLFCFDGVMRLSFFGSGEIEECFVDGPEADPIGFILSWLERCNDLP